MSSPSPLHSSASAAASLDALMSRVVSDATQAIVVCDGQMSGRPILHVNPEFERLTGYARSEALKKTLRMLLRPSGDAHEWDGVDAALVGDQAWRKPLPAARKDGTVFWADLHVYPLRHDNKITHWACMLTDVTERLELHQALHDSEARLRLLAENIRDLVVVHHLDGKCSYVSPSCQTMLGSGPEILVGDMWISVFHPADQARARRTFENHFTSREESHLIHRLRRHDGSYLWAETISKTRRDSAGRPDGIISVTRDISKRRHAQENLAAMHSLLDMVYETVPIGLCLLDAAGNIIQCNRAFARAFDQPPDALAGQAADTILPTTALSRATINQHHPCECECVDSHGTMFPAELTVVVFEPNSIANRLVALNSLRERKKIESRLREINQLESLGTLAGGIAHDFNNMLSIVLAYASLLRDASGDPARISHYADTILDAGRRGASVVRQLQLFANTHEAELAPANIHELIDKALAEHGPASVSPVQLVKQFGATKAVVTIDAGQFVQAIGRLIDNAVEAMPAGGTLTLRTTEVQQAAFTPAGMGEQKNFLRISVEDTGAGMDADTRSRMFEPFFSRGKKADSAGVGLAVVYGIMRAHGGSIEVDSAPGQGTRVHLLFPRTEAPAVVASRPPFVPVGPAHERRTILLAEDEQDIGMLWQEVFPAAGWRVIWARDGSEALRLFRVHREEIALVFTDIIMPLVDGWQVAETVRQEEPKMPLLIASGAFRRGDRSRTIVGPVTYLSKPYVPSNVLKLIENLVKTQV
ncbi:MAG: PAS domain S-box protein [Nibricoccus sp.]